MRVTDTDHENDVAKPRLGIEREHHAGRRKIAAHHALHSRRERDIRVGESLVHVIGDRAILFERGNHMLDRIDHVGQAVDVEERLLLASDPKRRAEP